MNTTATVVVVEDDETIRTLLQMLLRNAGFTSVRVAARGDTGLEMVRRHKPDLVLLDLMLPGIDGLSVCRFIRETPELAHTRIIMLTAKSEDADVVRGLEIGADDYVTKPFSRSVLLARIQAVLRRPAPAADGEPIDGLTLDEDSRTARLGGQEIPLTHAEARTLALLISSPGRVHTRQRILDAVKGVEQAVTERTVDVQMVGLRRKLGDWATHIETVRGIGYRLKP
ncbi:MAG: response regulator transcription factor [Kiritimatiellae bacterium]|nr:response regulator transcription factor [Kiritimatiellia bacterium]